MSGITPHGWLFTMTRYEALNGLDSVHFLKHLLSQTDRKLLVIWDGSPIHRNTQVKTFLAMAQPSKSILNGCLPMLLISIPMKELGVISSILNFEMFVVLIWRICINNSLWPSFACVASHT